MSSNRFRDFSDIGASVDGLLDREMRAENDVNGNAIYVGYAKPGSDPSDPAWMIKKFTYDGNDAVTRSQIANNNLNNIHVWDDRSSLFS